MRSETKKKLRIEEHKLNRREDVLSVENREIVAKCVRARACLVLASLIVLHWIYASRCLHIYIQE